VHDEACPLDTTFNQNQKSQANRNTSRSTTLHEPFEGDIYVGYESGKVEKFDPAGEKVDGMKAFKLPTE